jgi:hypothetical protein
MKEINLQDKTYLFVEQDLDSHSHSLRKMKTHAVIKYKRESTGDSNWSDNIGGLNVTLLDYEVISTTKDITEEQAGSIVEKKIIPNQPLIVGRETYFKQYGYTRKGWDFIYHTAKESLQSLIQANGLDVNKNYLILKANGTN